MVGSRYRWVDGLRRGSFIENVSTVARWPLLAGCCSDMLCNTDFELHYSIVWAAKKADFSYSCVLMVAATCSVQAASSELLVELSDDRVKFVSACSSFALRSCTAHGMSM